VSDGDHDLLESGDDPVDATEIAVPQTVSETDSSDDSHTEGAADGVAAPPSSKRKLDWTLIIPCFVIACGIVLIAWGATAAITGQDGIERPDAIETLSPVENAQQVVQREQIVVDLQFGYNAVLVVDGIELPTTAIGQFSGDLSPDNAGTQIETPPTAVFDPGNSRIEFRPTEGALIESLTEGRHEVQVIFWKIDEVREESARSYRWSFDVV